MSSERRTETSTGPTPEDVIIVLIESGLLKLPSRIEQLFQPYRQVKIVCKGICVENGYLMARVSFFNSDAEIPAKVLLLPIQVVDNQGGDFTHYQSACQLIRDLNSSP